MYSLIMHTEIFLNNFDNDVRLYKFSVIKYVVLYSSVNKTAELNTEHDKHLDCLQL